MKIVAIIPSRYASTRFPGKALAQIHGKSMIQRVYEQVSRVSILNDVIVATDDERIFQHVQSFGNVEMTSMHHLSGTDRVAEVAGRLLDADVVINVQGDEPFIEPDQIEQLCEIMKTPEVEIASLATPLLKEEIDTTSIVKVAVDQDMNVIYFKRRIGVEDMKDFYKHIGIYGFDKSVLLQLSNLEPTKSEFENSLEQLRWLDHGFRIKIGISNHITYAVDTPEDLEKLLKDPYFLNK